MHTFLFSNPLLSSHGYEILILQLHSILISGAKSAAKKSKFILILPFYPIYYGIFVPTFEILHNEAQYDKRKSVKPPADNVWVFAMMFYSEKADPRFLFSTSSIAGALFGMVHCLAWHFSFPSNVEQIMWKVASLGIAGICALSFMGSITWKDFVSIKGHKVERVCLISFLVLRFILLILTSVVYPVLRLVLLVLAVISLRSLPSSAFDTVDWIELVSHI